MSAPESARPFYLPPKSSSPPSWPGSPPASPAAPARRSAPAQAKASRQRDETGRPYRSFRGLLAHLGTLTRNELRLAGTPATVPVLSEPTSEQCQAFDPIGAAIPLTVRK